MKSSRAYVQIYSTLKEHLSLLERSASNRLEGLSRASLRVDRVKVRRRKSRGIIGRVERVGCGGKALEVLAVVRVCLQIISIKQIS